MIKDLLKQPVELPSAQFMIMCVLGILFFTSIFKYQDTIYLINKTARNITGSGQVVIGNKSTDDSEKQYAQKSQESKVISNTTANVQTMIIWGFFGLVVYIFAYSFFMVFINPLESDNKESHFVHANKKYLHTKRILWCSTIAVVTAICIGLWTIVTTMVMPYYQLMIYDFSLSTTLVFTLSVVLSMFVVVGIRLGARVIIRTY